MFAKSYKLKSNNTLKNSEKKHLSQRMREAFSGATEENVKELIPIKSNCSCMKLILHSGDMVGVYAVDGLPIVIEDDKGLVPTVCALWKVPNLIPMLIIHTPVLSKVVGGAPLYLPGIERGASGCGWAPFSRGSPVAACTNDNQAAAIVGRAALSSREMVHLVAGTCLETIQVYGDQLCKESKFNRIERPKLGAASYPNEDVIELATDLSQLNMAPVKEEWPSLGPRTLTPAPAAPTAVNEPKIIPEAPEDAPPEVDDDCDPTLDDTAITDTSQAEEDSIPSDMEGLLRWCLLSFLKLEGKRLELPLKTNLLYKNHLMPLCPPDRTLDVKKSSYKKMSKFLEAMQEEGLLEVREVEKGVSALVAVDLSHAALRRHEPAPRPRVGVGVGVPRDYTPPLVREMFCVTAAVQDLFPGVKRGTAVSAGEVRAAVASHVRTRSLPPPGAGAVPLDATLARILGKREQEVVRWEEVMAGTQARLTAATEMRFADGTLRLTKTKLEPVTMQVASRSGNKKVTLVSNLEQFGFNLQALSHLCQQAVAASCGVTRSPGARADQLMLQGDQTHFVAKLLIEKYGLPKKYVEGADKALKKKK